jgi:putative ABC transport system substrate-binding protein
MAHCCGSKVDGRWIANPMPRERPECRVLGIGRREFVTLLGGAATLPLAARAEQADRVRRIGVVTSALETDANLQALYAVLRQALQQLGWTEGRSIKLDRRLGSAGTPRNRRD